MQSIQDLFLVAVPFVVLALAGLLPHPGEAAGHPPGAGRAGGGGAEPLPVALDWSSPRSRLRARARSRTHARAPRSPGIEHLPELQAGEYPYMRILASVTYTVSVAGASGYAGGELLRLVLRPSRARARGRSRRAARRGQPVSASHPQLVSLADRDVRPAPTPTPWPMPTWSLLALPHGESAALVAALPPDLPVVDLGADFRLARRGRLAAATTAASPTPAPGPTACPSCPGSASGSPARPGSPTPAATRRPSPCPWRRCWPPSWSSPQDIVVVAASGHLRCRPQGRGLDCWPARSWARCAPYKVGGVHQHTPEMEQALTAAAGQAGHACCSPRRWPRCRAGSWPPARPAPAAGVTEDDPARRPARGLRRRAVRPCPARRAAADARPRRSAPTACTCRSPLDPHSGRDDGARGHRQPGQGRGRAGAPERQPASSACPRPWAFPWTESRHDAPSEPGRGLRLAAATGPGRRRDRPAASGPPGSPPA